MFVWLRLLNTNDQYCNTRSRTDLYTLDSLVRLATSQASWPRNFLVLYTRRSWLQSIDERNGVVRGGMVAIKYLHSTTCCYQGNWIVNIMFGAWKPVIWKATRNMNDQDSPALRVVTTGSGCGLLLLVRSWSVWVGNGDGDVGASIRWAMNLCELWKAVYTGLCCHSTIIGADRSESCSSLQIPALVAFWTPIVLACLRCPDLIAKWYFGAANACPLGKTWSHGSVIQALESFVLGLRSGLITSWRICFSVKSYRYSCIVDKCVESDWLSRKTIRDRVGDNYLTNTFTDITLITTWLLGALLWLYLSKIDANL